MTIVVVCAGGPKNELCSFEQFKKEQSIYFIGADRGSLYLLEQGIIPDEAIGDFDSLADEEWLQITKQIRRIEKVNAEKDETDTELALLKALTYKPNEIYVMGITGGRLDHYESALQLVFRIQKNHPQVKIKIINKQNELSILFPGQHTIMRNELYPFISFFTFNERVENISLSGVKYETINDAIELGDSRFTSNELVASVGYISFSSGICLMIRSGD